MWSASISASTEHMSIQYQLCCVMVTVQSYLGFRQNSFMALTAVMKLFWVYLAPYSLFFRTARTAHYKRGNHDTRLSSILFKPPNQSLVSLFHVFITFHLNCLSFSQPLSRQTYESKDLNVIKDVNWKTNFPGGLLKIPKHLNLPEIFSSAYVDKACNMTTVSKGEIVKVQSAMPNKIPRTNMTKKTGYMQDSWS